MKTKWLAIGVLLLSVCVGAGCSSTDTSGGGGNGGDGGDGDETSGNFFYTSAREVGPTFEAAAAGAQIAKGAGATKTISNSLMNNIYSLLQDYEYPADEGMIDMHNIYKVIYTAGQIYAAAEGGCTPITEAAVLSPFNLGITDTYNCAGNEGTMADAYASGFAIKDTTTLKYGLLTFRWASSEHGVLQGSYNDSTTDLNIKMVELVDHDESHFYVRSHIAGNATTHAFTLSMITGSITDATNYTSLLGKGISHGAGNYFLFKVKDSSIDGNYFCIPADATEATLDALATANPTGSTTVDTNCTAYQTDVDAMTFLTTADVPMALSDFASSSILLTY